MKVIFKILIVSVILLGCHKNCPKPGNYRATFNGTYESTGAISTEVGFTSISETSKDSFFIGYSKINKYGKNIIGEIGGSGNLAWAKIEGVCQKKKGKYFLTGTYKASDYGGGIINGEFEIKSN